MTGLHQAGSPGQQTSSSLSSGPLPPLTITERERETTTTSLTFNNNNNNHINFPGQARPGLEMLKLHLPHQNQLGRLVVATSLRYKNGPREKKTWAASAGQE